MKKKQDQPRLFQEPEDKIRDDFPVTVTARHDDKPTSHRWAKLFRPESKKCRTILCLFREGKKSSKQVAQIIGEEVQNVSPIFAPLERLELIRACGEDGNWTLYELMDLGREYALQLIRNGGS